jgi:hypothetical protein
VAAHVRTVPEIEIFAAKANDLTHAQPRGQRQKQQCVVTPPEPAALL